MADPTYTPAVYKCGHTINIVSPGVSDPNSKLAEEHAATGQPVKFDRPCWNCGDGFKTQVPAHVTEMLRKAKRGEE